MSGPHNSIRFVLNDRDITLTQLRPGDTLLEHLRLEQGLCGTRQGCAEGDCGACTVLIGRLRAGELIYRTATACICLLGMLDGCHVVTIEHLQDGGGGLHPVQQALVMAHASQCGFCTPGIVMSLYALWLENREPAIKDIEKALQGNLCRCTGYKPVVEAAQMAMNLGTPATDRLVTGRKEMAARLNALSSASRIDISSGGDRVLVPRSLDDLARMYAELPNATLVAGATDAALQVTRQLPPVSQVIYIAGLDELHRIEVTDTAISIGAAVTYSEFAPVVERHIPQLSRLWDRIGGEQVRNMGTIGGNIANGSPVGDTPPALIALGASLVLRRGGKRRMIALEEYFLAYGSQDRREGEFIEAIHIPRLPQADHYAAYKVSKRRDEDISSVCAAFRIGLENGIVKTAILAYGGMAATPKRARGTERALVGQPWCKTAVSTASARLKQDFSPLDDWRASARYRRLVAANLLTRFFLETAGHAVQLDRFNPARAGL